MSTATTVLRIGSRCSFKSVKTSFSVTAPVPGLPRAFSVLGPKRIGTHAAQLGSALKGHGSAIGSAPSILSQQRSFHASAPTSASQQDPYTLLGVKKTASQSEIKKAYYQLAKQYHPDTNKDPAAREKFVQIQEAYEILSDEQKKAQYDEFGHAGFNGNSPHGAGGFPGGFPGGFSGGAGGFGNFEDVFDFFGGGFGGPRGSRSSGFSSVGEDLEVPLVIDFMEAVKGASKKVMIDPIRTCEPCHGFGTKSGKAPDTCKVCHGTGQQKISVQGFHMSAPCQACGGVGTMLHKGKECNTCGGVGRVRVHETVDVHVPPGADEGVRIRLGGKGHKPVHGEGRSGDVFVRLRVKPSSLFKRQGADVYTETTIPFTTAALGGTVKIPTVDGDVELKVPSGTQPNDVSRLAKRGIQRLNRSDKGDQFVTMRVSLPKTLSKTQREILEKFAEVTYPGTTSSSSSSSSSDKDDSHHSAGGFFKSTFDKLKDKLHHEDIKKDDTKKDEDKKD
ncbi:hypothetical protein BC939DRAFT_466308 [Gamsiella multidivaricata]|uniref:uncharacterized protein n=1 Tax=Gamsiella multidivaricata TaxID=101098 RepID=UPI00221ECB47|nr:uncharacterized protein BC939DRAFT_466308 [Gamsiella multidivaricata]KAG0368216.1 hypothetical protein BGZ54_002454 [Gamsiella multidivaricata]KAI7817312.1 hypothetical protein BC939DRAFT_466308 [Gamsiella multidivaricata]